MKSIQFSIAEWNMLDFMIHVGHFQDQDQDLCLNYPRPKGNKLNKERQTVRVGNNN